MAEKIHFGTDGWRGVIADDFTFANVRRVAQAIAAYVHRYEYASRGVLVAYDTRFGSLRFAEIAAETIAATGIRVQIAREITPTPALSYMVRQRGAAGGVMITSSHNPWNWNGVKFKAAYGGSATPEITRKIEALLDVPPVERGGGSVVEADLMTEYIAAIRAFADLDSIARARQKFAIDVMHGAGRGILAGIFRSLGVEHLELHGTIDPLFPGMNPEPILPHLGELQQAVVAEGCAAVLLEWLLKRRQWPGAVTRACNTSGILDRIARAHGRRLIEHGVGFKHVAALVLAGTEVLIGGEESGGIGIPRFLPERDGTLNALLLANVMADEGRALGELVEDLQRRYGRHSYRRRDLHLDDATVRRALERAASRPRSLGPFKVLRAEEPDGIKFFLDAPRGEDKVPGADAWVLVRGSGTEPLLRVYAEAAAAETAEQILDATIAFVLKR
jgi:phosphomannomutase